MGVLPTLLSHNSSELAWGLSCKEVGDTSSPPASAVLAYRLVHRTAASKVWVAHKRLTLMPLSVTKLA